MSVYRRGSEVSEDRLPSFRMLCAVRETGHIAKVVCISVVYPFSSVFRPDIDPLIENVKCEAEMRVLG